MVPMVRVAFPKYEMHIPRKSRNSNDLCAKGHLILLYASSSASHHVVDWQIMGRMWRNSNKASHLWRDVCGLPQVSDEESELCKWSIKNWRIQHSNCHPDCCECRLFSSPALVSSPVTDALGCGGTFNHAWQSNETMLINFCYFLIKQCVRSFSPIPFYTISFSGQAVCTKYTHTHSHWHWPLKIWRESSEWSNN